MIKTLQNWIAGWRPRRCAHRWEAYVRRQETPASDEATIYCVHCGANHPCTVYLYG